jgi:branched-chain amino acid transport system permease protein
LFSAYIITILTLMGIWSIVALGLNIITGLAGQFNLGIGVYMGTGAYTTAMLTTTAGFGFWQALPCAVAASTLMGLLTGWPALRVREDSLAVLSIGLVFVFESLLVYLPYFGGPIGIAKLPRAMLDGKPVTNDEFLLIVAGVLTAAMGVCVYVRRSWMGLAWESIRENELAAQTLGINPARFKLYAFMIGAGLAGLGGVIYAHFIRYVTPYDFGFLPSVYVLVMVVFGGLGTVRGAVFGACFLTFLPELFRFVDDYRNMIYGIILVVLMLYEPRGLLGDGSRLCRALGAGWRHLRAVRNNGRPFAANQ